VKWDQYVPNPRRKSIDEEFIEFAMRQGDLTRDQAKVASARYRKERLIRVDVHGGGWTLTHGAFGDRDVLRRAAEVD
jgi:hypothetical protein